VAFAFKANPEDFFVYQVAFSSDGALLALSTGDCFPIKKHEKIGSVRVWDTRTGKLTKVLKVDSYAVFRAAISPNGTYVAGASQDGRVLVWNLATGKEAWSLQPSESVTALAFSPDSKWLARAGYGDGVHILDVASGRLVLELRGHERNRVMCVAYSPDGNRLATGGQNGMIKLWDLQTGQETLTLQTATSHMINSVAFNPDGMFLAANESGTLKIWETASNETPVIRPKAID
jgi:WD40 repeat protein